MGKNTKPMLTVLVEGDKLQQFRDYALSKEVSMGWLVNRLLDRLLSGELDVMGDTPSIGVTRENIESVSTGLTRENVESIVKSSIDNQLVDSNRDYIEELIKSCIDSLGISSTGTNHIEGMARASIEEALEPIKESVSELETYTRSQFAAVRDELRAISNRSVTTESLAKPLQGRIANAHTSPCKEKPNVDGNTRTWCGFFEMVGMTAMTATEAQKKENVDIRTQQIERGLQSATDQGLGEWAVKRAGREFVRVDATPEASLPLFPN